MVPAVGPALFTLCTALAMAVYLLARRHKDPLHWMLLGYLVGLVMWTAGVLARFTVTSHDGLAVSLRVVFTGVLLSSSFWLLTAVTYVQRRTASSRTNPALVVLVVSSLFALALFTNDGHRLFIRRVDFPSVAAGPRAYVGPVFWVFLVWAYGCVGLGMLLYLRAARTMLRADSRRRGLLLAIASAVPPVSSTLYVFQLLPVRYDLTPAGLMIAMILLSLAVFRYQLLESLPLARDAVLAQLEDGVVMASASGRVTQWNPAAARILGTSQLRRGDDLDALLAQQADPADGRVIEVITAVVDEGRGEPAGRFAILSDRSEIDRIERHARQTQRLEIVGALAGEVAHQISDPLTFVRANLAEIERMGARVEAERDGPDAELAAELADLRAVALETLEGVERIRRIVDGMRALSSAERVDTAEVDLNAAARDALRLARLGDEGGDGPAVQLSLGALPPVRGNAERLVQVVLNLLVNARQALLTTPGATIRVETRHRGGEVELAVSDNGPGIPEGVRHRVFDPFFTTRGPDEGTGLGLAIAFDIAREHGGALETRAQPREGACFLLRLPALGSNGGAPGASGPGREMETHLE